MRKRKKKEGCAASEELGRFGNFAVKRMGDGQGTWIRVMSVDGEWRMDFGDGTLRYGWICSCLASGSEGVRRALESWIVLSWHMAHVWPDPEFIDEAIGVFTRLQERTVAVELEKENKDTVESA